MYEPNRICANGRGQRGCPSRSGNGSRRIWLHPSWCVLHLLLLLLPCTHILPGYEPPEKLEAEITIARTALQTPAEEPLRVGIGFVGWVLDENAEDGRTLVLTALKHRVAAVWLSFGEDLGKWVQFVRDEDARRADGHTTLIFAQLSSVEDILVAVQEWHVDVIVVQGRPLASHRSQR